MEEKGEAVVETRTGVGPAQRGETPSADAPVLTGALAGRPGAVLALQRAAGNRATRRWLSRDPDPPVAPPVSSTGFRDEIARLLDSIPDEGITEGDQGLKGWISAADIAYNRKVMGAGWTSCIAFQGAVLERAKAAAQKKNKGLQIYSNVQGMNAEKNGAKKGAWHAADSGYQPRKGDMYRLNFADHPDKFSHVGFIRDVKDLGNGMQEWITVDGGQRAGQGQPDKIAIKKRQFDRTKGLVLGGENADPNPRLLLGWVNVDELTSGAATPAPAAVSRRTLARDPLPGRDASDAHVALAAALAPDLDDDEKGKAAVARLDALAPADLAFTLKLLVEGYGKKDRLVALAASATNVKAGLAAVTDPAGVKGGAGLDGLGDEQKNQMRGFARRREWPTAIPVKGDTAPAELADPKSELSAIVAAIVNERASIEDTMGANWSPPTLKQKPPKGTAPLGPADVQAMTVEDQHKKFVTNLRGGYMKSASTGSHDPTSFGARGKVADADKPRVEAINKLIWEELGHEGSVSSINTYDDAILTWGKGWAAHGGRLPKLMEKLPQTIKDKLLDLGFAYQGGWLALDTANKAVLKGDEALQYVRFNTRILSAMYAMGFNKDVQGLVDAQALVMFDEFDKASKAIRDLDDRLIMVIVHCCWWGHMTLGQAETLTSGKSTTDALRDVVRWQSHQGGCNAGQSADGAWLVTGWQAQLFNVMGRGVIGATFTDRADEPTADHKDKTLIKPPGAKKYIVV